MEEGQDGIRTGYRRCKVGERDERRESGRTENDEVEVGSLNYGLRAAQSW